MIGEESRMTEENSIRGVMRGRWRVKIEESMSTILQARYYPYIQVGFCSIPRKASVIIYITEHNRSLFLHRVTLTTLKERPQSYSKKYNNPLKLIWYKACEMPTRTLVLPQIRQASISMIFFFLQRLSE